MILHISRTLISVAKTLIPPSPPLPSRDCRCFWFLSPSLLLFSLSLIPFPFDPIESPFLRILGFSFF